MLRIKLVIRVHGWELLISCWYIFSSVDMDTRWSPGATPSTSLGGGTTKLPAMFFTGQTPSCFVKAAFSNPEDKTSRKYWNIVLQIWHKHIHLVKTQRYSSISTWILLYLQFPKFWPVENDGYKCFSFQYLETSRGREMDTAHVSLVTLSPSRTSFWFYLPLFRPLHVCIWGLRGDHWKVCNLNCIMHFAIQSESKVSEKQSSIHYRYVQVWAGCVPAGLDQPHMETPGRFRTFSNCPSFSSPLLPRSLRRA